MGTSRQQVIAPFLSLGTALLLTAGPGCAKVSTPADGSGGAGASSGGGGGTSGGGGGRMGSGSGGMGGLLTSTTDAGANCMMASISFEPQIPTVYILVDRSGSVFTPINNVAIFPTLRTAVLDVIRQLESEVRFGLGVFTGDMSAASCLQLTSVPTDINNYAAIERAYSALGQPAFKAETPAALAIPIVKAALQADQGRGRKYMLFVTDSETDYCDDPGPQCPVDTVTYRIQDMYKAGFGTFIFGLPSDQTQVAPAALQAWANAGAGLPVAAPPGVSGANPTMEIVYQCASWKGWMDVWTEAQRTGMTATATYSPATTNAPVFKPDPTDTAALTAQLRTVVQGVKSCSFNLDSVGGTKITVHRDQLGRAKILIEGQEIPYDATNGWTLPTDRQLDLVGTACETWKRPENKNIDFQFPCGVITID